MKHSRQTLTAKSDKVKETISSASGLHWGDTMRCIKWSENNENKSHSIFICQGFVSHWVFSLFTTLIPVACCSYKMWLRINTDDLKLSSHFPASRGKMLTACVLYPRVSPQQNTYYPVTVISDVKPVETGNKWNLLNIHTMVPTVSSVVCCTHACNVS